MDWKGVGNAVIKAGAPLLGGALFGPAGSFACNPCIKTKSSLPSSFCSLNKNPD